MPFISLLWKWRGKEKEQINKQTNELNLREVSCLLAVEWENGDSFVRAPLAPCYYEQHLDQEGTISRKKQENICEHKTFTPRAQHHRAKDAANNQQFPSLSVVARITDLIRWHQKASIWTCLWKVLLLRHFLWWPGASWDHKGNELHREGTCLT